MSLADKINLPRPTPRRKTPLWKGPQVDGITFSLLSRYLACKERFRIMAVEGLKPAKGFSHRLEYGTMWHLCEEWFAKEDHGNPSALSTGVRVAPGTWRQKLEEHCRELCKTYRTAQADVVKWYNVCLKQFPHYTRFWADNEDVRGRHRMLQEYEFCTRYPLPSGRVVTLRGKWDSTDWIDCGATSGVYLQENKTKGDVYEPQIRQQLTFDLQTMIYLTAMSVEAQQGANSDLTCLWNKPIRGVRYNVVRRPLSGGKGNIKQLKTETPADYYNRLEKYIADEPAAYFMRWKVEVFPADVGKFRVECLGPVLDNLLDDYEWWAACFQHRTDVFNYGRRYDQFPHHRARHYREPYGVYNPLDEGGSTDLDEYLATGSEVGLTRVNDLFPELQNKVA